MGKPRVTARMLVVGAGLISVAVPVVRLIAPDVGEAVHETFPGPRTPDGEPPDFAIDDDKVDQAREGPSSHGAGSTSDTSLFPQRNSAVAPGVFGTLSPPLTQPIPEFIPVGDSSGTMVGYIRWPEMEAAMAASTVLYTGRPPSSLVPTTDPPGFRTAVYNREGVRIGALVNGTYLPGDLLPTPGEGAPVSPPEQLPAEQPTTPPTASTP